MYGTRLRAKINYIYGTNKIQGQETNWTQMGANTIGNVVCEQVKTRAADSLVVLATHGNGIYTTKIQSVEDVIEVTEFEIQNNLNVYPNPANKYLIIETSDTDFYEFYDLQGKLIQKNKIIHIMQSAIRHDGPGRSEMQA